MITLKHILVPTDFSETSEAAAKYGVALARAFNATLHLLHVEPRRDLQIMVERELVVEKLGDPTATAPPQNAARELLGRILTEHEEKELRAEYVLRASGLGGPYVEIVRYAKERTIDLIVMGTHGRGFVAHMLMGSVAEKVVRKAPCPVLTVRHPEHEFVIPDEPSRPPGRTS
jgi:nucleotide-binding universal stress UspA family protein